MRYSGDRGEGTAAPATSRPASTDALLYAHPNISVSGFSVSGTALACWTRASPQMQAFLTAVSPSTGSARTSLYVSELSCMQWQASSASSSPFATAIRRRSGRYHHPRPVRRRRRHHDSTRTIRRAEAKLSEGNPALEPELRGVQSAGSDGERSFSLLTVAETPLTIGSLDRPETTLSHLSSTARPRLRRRLALRVSLLAFASCPPKQSAWPPCNSRARSVQTGETFDHSARPTVALLSDDPS